VRNPTLPLGLSLLLLLGFHFQSLQASAEPSRDQKQMLKTLRLGLNRQLQLLPTRPRHSCPDNSSFRQARQSNSG
jgi:hypothetical protein